MKVSDKIRMSHQSFLLKIEKISDEHLIKYAWPEDIWFHVSKLSSAHVYLRLPKVNSKLDIIEIASIALKID